MSEPALALISALTESSRPDRRTAFPRILRRHDPQSEHVRGVRTGDRRLSALVRNAGLTELRQIQPAYIEAMQSQRAALTVKQQGSRDLSARRVRPSASRTPGVFCGCLSRRGIDRPS